MPFRAKLLFLRGISKAICDLVLQIFLEGTKRCHRHTGICDCLTGLVEYHLYIAETIKVLI